LKAKSISRWSIAIACQLPLTNHHINIRNQYGGINIALLLCSLSVAGV